MKTLSKCSFSGFAVSKLITIVITNTSGTPITIGSIDDHGITCIRTALPVSAWLIPRAVAAFMFTKK